MRPIISIVLPVHWMAVFLLMAILLSSGPSGFAHLLGFLGVSDAAAVASFPEMGTALLGAGLGLVAATFLWLVVAALAGDRRFPGAIEDVAGLAFGTAIVMVTIVFLVAAPYPLVGLLPPATVLAAALAASYAAVQAERRAIKLHRPDRDVSQSKARTMAVGAAHLSMLSRVSGRGTDRSGV